MSMTLSDTSPAEQVELINIPDDEVRVRLLRLGFLDDPVECCQQIRNGPVVLRHRGTEIALGKDLAQEIDVKQSESSDTRS